MGLQGSGNHVKEVDIREVDQGLECHLCLRTVPLVTWRSMRGGRRTGGRGHLGGIAGAIRGPEEQWGWGFKTVRRKVTARCGPDGTTGDFLVSLESLSGW